MYHKENYRQQRVIKGYEVGKIITFCNPLLTDISYCLSEQTSRMITLMTGGVLHGGNLRKQ